MRNLDKPAIKHMNEDIDWLCESFGLCSGRDMEHMSTNVVRSIVFHAPVFSPEQLARELGVGISRVNHHLRNLADSGLIRRERKTIILRGGSLTGAVLEIRKDMERIMDEVELIARDIDASLGLRSRDTAAVQERHDYWERVKDN